MKGLPCWRPALLAACLGLLSGPAWALAGLEAALEAALTHHPAIGGKQAELDARAFGGDTARSERYPTLSAQAQQGVGSGDNDSPVNLRVRQPLWAFGRIDNNIAFADAQTEAEQADLLRVRRQLLEQTAVAYARVQGSRRSLEVAAENIDAHRQLHRQIQRRARGELASGADVSLATTRLAQAETRHELLLGELDVALNELQSLTQITVDTTPGVPDALLRLPVPEMLEELALENSAEILHKQRLIAGARAGVAQARTAAMPTLYLQLDQDYDQPGYGNDSRAGLVLEGSLDGLGFASRGRTRTALAEQNAAEQALLNARNDTTRISQRLIRQRQLQQTLQASLAMSIQELDSLLDSYRRQYETGTKSWQDLLNIQRELADQRLQQVQAQNDWLVYSLQLMTLIGGFDALIKDDADHV